MFAYCGNNPVMKVDPSGEIAITTIILIASIVAGCLMAAHTAVASYNYYGEVKIVDTIIAGLSTFAFVYSFGMSAYGVYISCCQYYGHTPVTDISFSHNASVQSQLQDCANYADKSIDGSGHTVGTFKHSIFREQVEMLNNPNIKTEVSYKNEVIVDYGTKGSVRLDAVLYENEKVVCAWDYKTGTAVLTPQRISQIQTHVGQVPIYEIRGK